MECSKAKKMVVPYIRDELEPEVLEDFLEHIKECEGCKEELEIYYTIEEGLDKLDSGNNDFNILGSLEDYIHSSYYKVNKIRATKIFYYILNTLICLSVAVILLLQIRIWNSYSFFGL